MLLTLLLGLLVVGFTVVIQGFGTYFWMLRFQNYHERLTAEQFRKKTVRILILTSSFLIFMHLIQSGIWAGLYLMHPGIDVAVVGIKSPPQITEAVGAMGKTISREDYFVVRKILAIEGISKIKDAGGERK